MNKLVLASLILFSLICISGQMPYKKNPEVAVTKEVAPVVEEKAAEQKPKEEKRVGVAKRQIQGQPQVKNSERKGAAQKVREGIR